MQPGPGCAELTKPSKQHHRLSPWPACPPFRSPLTHSARTVVDKSQKRRSIFFQLFLRATQGTHTHPTSHSQRPLLSKRAHWARERTVFPPRSCLFCPRKDSRASPITIRAWNTHPVCLDLTTP